MRCGLIAVAMVFVMMTAGVSAAPLVTGELMVYYDFESVGGDGATVTDGSGNGYDGTIAGNVVQTTGPSGGAAQFWTEGVDVSGTNWNFVDLPVADIFSGGDIPTSSFTLAALFKTKASLTTDGNSDQAIFCPLAAEPVGSSKVQTWLLHPEIRGRATPTDDYYRFTLRSPEMTSIGDVNAGEGDANEGPNWDQWTHIAFTYDKNTATMKVYENGVVIGQNSAVTASDMPANWDLGARVGCNVDDARQFLGALDEVYIFNRTLNSAEIGVLASAVPEPGTLALLASGLFALGLLRRRR